jgi:hypothetical protein
MTRRKRRHPLLRAFLHLQRWCFAPVASAVKGTINRSELGRVAVVAGVPLLLQLIADNATTLFINPSVAVVVNALLVALVTILHRLHDGQPQ